MSAAPPPQPAPRRIALWVLLLGSALLLSLIDWDRSAQERTPEAPSGADDDAQAQATAPASPRSTPSVRGRALASKGQGAPLRPGQSSQPGSPITAQPPAAAITPECRRAGAYGRCAGDLAQACVDGRLISVDCSARHERCVMTGEGASCLPSAGPLDCEADSAVTCRGDRLQHCVDGRMQEIDCSLLLAFCEQHGQHARCVRDGDNEGEASTEPPAKLELCDGKDNDDDQHVDEGNVCAPVPLAAFVPKGANLRDQAQRMQIELAILNRMYAPIQFTWREPIEVAAALRAFDPKQLDAVARLLARDPEATASPTRAADPTLAANPTPATPATVTGSPRFYIPVLFAETIVGEPPKVGISTLPNSRCGGVRVTQQPAPLEGVVVVSDRRRPETLAHEVGHYLGLCHTHMELADYVPAAKAYCDETGDGICDTPWDPGPERCTELEDCSLQCSTADAKPDSSNVMSYYMGCRTKLSAEQLAEAERNLSLRRGWSTCLAPEGCACTPGDPGGCPQEMSCSPAAANAQSGGQCLLDGPALPGAKCEDVAQCSQQSTCVQAGSAPARCARTCRTDAEHCTCTDLGASFRVCREDLEP